MKIASYLFLLLVTAAVVETALDPGPSLSRHLRVRAPHQSLLRAAPRSVPAVPADAPALPAPGARNRVISAEPPALPSPVSASVFVPPRTS